MNRSPAALVEDEVEAEERLQPPAEPRLRSPRPLGDRADPPARRGVEVDDAIRLAVADAAEHDRLGLEIPGHGPLNVAGQPGRVGHLGALCAEK